MVHVIICSITCTAQKDRIRIKAITLRQGKVGKKKGAYKYIRVPIYVVMIKL